MKKILLISIITALIMSSCTEDDIWFGDDRRVTGTGDLVTESVLVPEFTRVDLESVANVYIQVGTPQKVEFTTYENILPYMKARVVGDVLLLQFTDDISVNSDEEIKIDIAVENLEKVTLSGVGNFYIEGPSQDEVKFELNGVGNIEAFNLPVYHAYVDINGTGNVEVNSKETLDVDIDGLGNVYYMDNPDITSDISGLGSVIRNND